MVQALLHVDGYPPDASRGMDIPPAIVEYLRVGGRTESEVPNTAPLTPLLHAMEVIIAKSTKLIESTISTMSTKGTRTKHQKKKVKKYKKYIKYMNHIQCIELCFV